jgi:site-specific DNA-methyltransferase (adenine-specific)
MNLRNRTGHVPDILDCLAQLSNDEVPTPPKLARAVLDLLPSDVWEDPQLKWLDPFCKSGVFLREIATRLLIGLSAWEPDFEKRREHIFRDMLFGTSITQMTGHIARRSLYYSRDASGPQSVVKFERPDGNLPFVLAHHVFQHGKCLDCRAAEAIVREGRENHAYSFIHDAYPTQEMSDMKFDVIVGNPPYQIGIDNDRDSPDANPVYQYFVTKAIETKPRHIAMIIPSRWFTGGKAQLDSFRAQMIADRHLEKIVDNPQLFDCFPGVEIKGGVNYFLWSRDHSGDCEFSTRVDGVIVSSATRDLREGSGVLIRDNNAASIIRKVNPVIQGTGSLADVVATRYPFGPSLMSNFKGAAETPFAGSVPLIFVNKVGYIRPDQVTRNHEWINKWKVLLPKASDGHGRQVSYVLGEPIALAPGSICTQTYLVAGTFGSKVEAQNYAHYLATKFVRFLVLQRKSTQDVTPDRFRFVPQLDMTRRWDDDALFEKFRFSASERSYINSTIHERAVNLSLDSPVPTSHLPGGDQYRTGETVPSSEDYE